MLEVKNVKVYDLRESIMACRNAMKTEMPDEGYYDNEEEFAKGLSRAIKLVRATKESPNVKCHDNFMTGIRVSFDLKYTQYITKQFQRYHWFDYVSSSSLMHKITKMDFSKCCTEYVSKNSIDEVTKWKTIYNDIVENHTESYHFDNGVRTWDTDNYQDTVYRAFMLVINNCPMGAELFVRVSTNYKQLQTIYWQRKDHKLKEDWGEFTKFIESLPYANELILGKE